MTVSSVGLAKQIIKHFQQHQLVRLLLVLLHHFDVHLVEGRYPFVDHEPGQNEVLDGVRDLGERLEGYVLFLLALGSNSLILVLIQRSKHLEVCLELVWHINSGVFVGLIVLEYVDRVRDEPFDVPLVKQMVVCLFEEFVEQLVEEPAVIGDALRPSLVEVMLNVDARVLQQHLHFF